MVIPFLAMLAIAVFFGCRALHQSLERARRMKDALAKLEECDEKIRQIDGELRAQFAEARARLAARGIRLTHEEDE